jgi:hypothetical protein
VTRTAHVESGRMMPASSEPLDEHDAAYAWSAAEIGRGAISTPNDMPIRVLLDEIAAQKLVVAPKFQRKTVWGRDRQSRLIESLLLRIPIPSLYFAEDDDEMTVVVDGQQRLRAIAEFHAGRYALQRLDLLAMHNGKRWADLSAPEAATILDTTLRCIVISAESPAALRFEMFERLSTGGLPLNDQELRNCVYRGAFNDLLHDIVRTTAWLAIVGKTDADLRMRHEELALRFFALRAVLRDYRPPVRMLLNDFMRRNRNPPAGELFAMAALFERALTNCATVFGARAFRRLVQPAGKPARWETNLNRAVYELQMLSFADLSTKLVNERAAAIRDAFGRSSLEHPAFAAALATSASDRPSFYTRLRVWLQALDDVGIASPLADELPPSHS